MVFEKDTLAIKMNNQNRGFVEKFSMKLSLIIPRSSPLGRTVASGTREEADYFPYATVK